MKDLVTVLLFVASEEINLIKSILRVTPYKRPTIKEILSHPYFNEEESTKGSTKESEMDKLNKSTHEHTTMYKPQQKSYPVYSQTTIIHHNP